MNFDKIIKLDKTALKARLEKELKGFKYHPISADGYLYAEGTLPVLLVAHMDTVHKSPVSVICKSSDGVWMAPEGIGGDDRCGIYSVLQIARLYKCHVLFTEDEEIGCIGAKKFTESGIKPEVNFIIEFDRKGLDDCVFYQCDNPKFTKYIESFGFKTQYGSCSDISTIAPYIGKAAVNLSCGYYNPHTQHEFIVLDHMWETIRKVENILDEHAKGTLPEFEYIRKVYTPAKTYYSSPYRWGDDDGDEYYGNVFDNAWWTQYLKEKEAASKSSPQTVLTAIEQKKKEADGTPLFSVIDKKANYTENDEEVQDVIWLDLYEDIWYVKHIKDDSGEVFPISEFGVDVSGNIWHWDSATGIITVDEDAVVVDSNGDIMSPVALYCAAFDDGMVEVSTIRSWREEEAR